MVITASTADRSPLVMLARAGYAARGVMYLIIGYFAVLAAIGAGENKDTKDALETVLAQPFGWGLLLLLFVGLIGYAGWRTVQAFADADNHGRSAKGLVIRAGLLASALVHLGLAVFAGALIFGFSKSGGSDPSASWLASAERAGFRQALIFTAALIPIAVGLAHLVKGWRADFCKRLECDRDTMDTLLPVCRAGLLARGVVFLIIGGMLIYAGRAYDLARTPGVKDALDATRQAPFGWALLLAIGLGLIAFAVYSFTEAVYRKIDV